MKVKFVWLMVLWIEKDDLKFVLMECGDKFALLTLENHQHMLLVNNLDTVIQMVRDNIIETISFHLIGAIIDRSGSYGYGGQPIVYSNVDCYGHEQDLSKCSKSVFPAFYCNSKYIIGLLCYDGKFVNIMSIHNTHSVLYYNN